jgi:hypothetical protein
MVRFLKGCLSGLVFGYIALQYYKHDHYVLGAIFIGLGMLGGILADLGVI